MAKAPRKVKNSAQKPARSGQTQAGESGHQHHTVEVGRLGGQTAEFGEVTGVCTFIDHADQKEERAGDDAVVEHLQRRAVDGHGCAVRTSSDRPAWLSPPSV